jgi:hypothetical protein
MYNTDPIDALELLEAIGGVAFCEYVLPTTTPRAGALSVEWERLRVAADEYFNLRQGHQVAFDTEAGIREWGALHSARMRDLDSACAGVAAVLGVLRWDAGRRGFVVTQ